MWLQDVNCIKTNYPSFDNDSVPGDGEVTWQHSLDFVAGINDETYPLCGAGYTDWKLPNVSEALSLSGTVPIEYYFSNYDAASYWTSSSHPYEPSSSYRVNLNETNKLPRPKNGGFYCVIPVRGGH